MKKRENSFVLVVSIVGLCMFAPRARAQPQHEGDLFVGRDGAGKLKVEFDFKSLTSLLPVSGFINGWSDAEPGIEALLEDEPEEDFFTMSPGAIIDFEVVSFHPAFKAHTPGFAQLLDTPGETWTIGGFDLHSHLNWHIDSDDPGFLESQYLWEATFRLKDRGSTGYTMSDSYTLRFTNLPPNVPTLSEWGLILMALATATAGTLILRRRGALVADRVGNSKARWL